MFNFGETAGLFRDPLDSSSDEEVDINLTDEVTFDKDVNSVMNFTSASGIVISYKQKPLKGIAHHIWPAATYFCNYLDSNKEFVKTNILNNNNEVGIPIIELGAGIGMLGIFCACLFGAESVIITDLAEALDTVNENIELNSLQLQHNQMNNKVIATELDWFDRTIVKKILSGNKFQSPPLILATDCVYF